MDKSALKRKQPGRSAKATTTAVASTSSAGSSSKKPKTAPKTEHSRPKAAVNAKRAQAIADVFEQEESERGDESDSESAEFDYLSIEATWDADSDYAMQAHTQDDEIDFTGIEPEDVEEMKNLFDEQSTHSLVINIDDCPKYAMAHYSAIFSSLTYKILEINFSGTHDASDFFLSFLPCITAGRDLSAVELKFTWTCDKPQNLPKLREALMLVPNVAKLDIEYCIEGEVDGSTYGKLYDDDTFSHLVTCSSDTKLGAAYYVTAEGFIDAFEAFCKASDDCRGVLVHVKDDVINEVFRLATRRKEQYGLHVLDEFRLQDKERKRTLCQLSKSSKDATAIMMMKDPPGADSESD